MRVANFCWGLCATLLVGNAAQADEPLSRFDDAPRFMLYVQKQVGSVRHETTGLSFGFAVDRASFDRGSQARIFDLRVAPFDGGALTLNGLRLTGEAPKGFGYSDSYGEGESWNNPWLWFGAAIVAGLGISCATDNWPCDDSYDGDDGYRVPGE